MTSIVTYDKGFDKILIKCQSSDQKCKKWFNSIVLDLACSFIGEWETNKNELEITGHRLENVEIITVPDGRKQPNIEFYLNNIASYGAEHQIPMDFHLNGKRIEVRYKPTSWLGWWNPFQTPKTVVQTVSE